MLNIKDIQERLRVNPEPQEVKDIRENILNKFNKLEFVEDGHKYFLPKKDGTKEELVSVSVMTQQFEPYADWEEITNEYSLRHDIPYETVKRMWHENNIRATNTGTGVHLYGENYMYFIQGHPELICDVIKPQYEDGYLIPHSPKECAVEKFYNDLFKVNDIYPVLAETRVYIGVNDKYELKQKYAGTFDMLFAIKHKGKWKLLIYDFKTNSSLTNDFNRQRQVMMLQPFNNMVDEAMSHYTLQLSAYELCLKQLDYEIIDRKLIWLKDDGEYEKISLPSISEEIAKALM